MLLFIIGGSDFYNSTCWKRGKITTHLTTKEICAIASNDVDVFFVLKILNLYNDLKTFLPHVSSSP